MDEGIFRILEALARGGPQNRTELVATAGEAPSVLKRALADHPGWFELAAQEVRGSESGLAALARELAARRAPVPEATDREKIDRLSELRDRRRVRRELDQVRSTPETPLARARLLIEAGEVQRGLVFLGDDDLTSFAIHLLGVSRRTTVIDVDAEILALLEGEAEREGWEHRSVRHDLRRPLPRELRGRFGCAFSDPPYATEGFALFVSRAIELLRPDGRLYVCFGYSRRASERGLQKQRVLADAGLLVERVLPDFNAYEGAQAVGSRSSLWIARVTPQSKPLVTGEVEGEIYARRPPRGS